MNDTMLLDIASIISVFGHFFTLYLILPFKRGMRFSLLAFSLFTAALFASSYLLRLEITVVTNLFRGILYLPVCIWLFRGQLYQKVFAFFQNFLLTSFQAALALELSRYIVPFESDKYILCFLIVYIFMFAAYLILLHLFWKKIFRKLFVDGRRREWVLYSLGAIFSYFAITVLRITLQTGLVYTMMLIFVLWGFCILCFAIINTHEKTRKTAEAEFAQNVVSSGRDRYLQMDEMYEKLRVLRHDYKYHLNAAREMLDAGDTKGADEYLTGVEKQLAEYDLRKYCSNTVINALIAGYAERCQGLNIKLDVNIKVPEALGIPDYDLCIIVGNLLENAVEACKKLSHNRVIKMETRSTDGRLLFMVKNSFNGVIQHEKGTPLSTKTNGGFGLRSITEVIARNGGDLTFEWDDSMFTAYVAVRL